MRLLFSESKEFYKSLDSSVEKGETTIFFDQQRPGEKSKLWLRLRKCGNWSLIEDEFEKIKANHETPVKKIISAPMLCAITGAEMFLIAWFATLIAAVFFYAIYKDRVIVLKTNINGDVELNVQPGK